MRSTARGFWVKRRWPPSKSSNRAPGICLRIASVPAGGAKPKNSPDKVLVALKGSTSQAFVEKIIPQAKLVLTDDYDQAVSLVRNDQAIAMVADYPICMVSVYRYPDAKVDSLDKPISYEPIGVALPPNDPLLFNWVQNFLNGLEKIGELKMIEERWFKDPASVKLLP